MHLQKKVFWRLEDYYCLGSVHLPHDWESIKEVEDQEEAKRRPELMKLCQVMPVMQQVEGSTTLSDTYHATLFAYFDYLLIGRKKHDEGTEAHAGNYRIYIIYNIENYEK